MSKVKIQGNASGTGVLTVTAPNTSTDRTITLPDSTDTLAVNSDVTNKLPLAGGTLTGNTTIATNSVPTLALKRTGNNAGNGYIECHGADDSVDYAIRFAQTNGVMSFDNGGSRIMGVTADGLTFGSDTSSANALDDYEEGTWTGTFTTASGSVTMNTAKDTGRYTKIGRTVHIHGIFVSQSHSSPSGELRLNGLPFACGSDTDLSDELWFYIGVNNIVNNNGATNQPLAAYIGPGMTHMIIYSCDGNNLADAGNRINNNGFMGFSVTYTI